MDQYGCLFIGTSRIADVFIWHIKSYVLLKDILVWATLDLLLLMILGVYTASVNSLSLFHHLDAKWQDMLAAFLFTMQNGDCESTIRDLEGLFGGANRCLACFSVRSALDLFLSIMQYPSGSEILMTAINIPDMVAIIQHHGLTIVPVDLDINLLCPRYEDMAALVTGRTVAILHAHIYGRRTNMDDVIRVAKEHKLLVLEDCAESFSGLSDIGHPQTDLAFFSFGAIKYATAMGGGIVRVKDPGILSKMRAKLNTYPVFPETRYIERLFRYSVVMFLVNVPLVTSFGVRLFNFFSIDYKELIVSLLRGFSGNIIGKIRYQPSTSLLRMMLRQLQGFDPSEHNQAKINGDFVMKNLASDLLIPGTNVDKLNYWLFPILVDNPKEWVKELEKEKIEAYYGVTQLNLVKPETYPTNSPTSEKPSHSTPVVDNSLTGFKQSTEPAEKIQDRSKSSSFQSKPSNNFGSINHEHLDLYPHSAKFLMDHVLYLPVHKRVPIRDLEALCRGVLRVAKRRHPGLVNSKEILVNQLRVRSKL